LAAGLLIGLLVMALSAGVVYYLLRPSPGPAVLMEGTPLIPPSATPLPLSPTPVSQLVETPTVGPEAPTRHPREVARFGRGTIQDIAYSPDGRILAVGGSLGVWLYHADTLEPIRLLEFASPVHKVVFSPDGRLLASAGWDGVRLWDMSTGELRTTLTGGIGPVAFSPDGRLLAAEAWDESRDEPVAIKVWDVVTGELRLTLMSGTRSVAFSSDGSLVASESDDTTVRLWDVATGELRATLTGHAHWVWSVAFSPDGRLLASGSDDGTVRLWDVESLR